MQTLEATLRLAHPIMPFITEEIWQRVAPLAGVAGDTIMRQPFPVADAALLDATAIAEIEWVKEFIVGVRQIRSGMNIAPGKPLPVLLQGASDEETARLKHNRHTIDFLART